MNRRSRPGSRPGGKPDIIARPAACCSATEVNRSWLSADTVGLGREDVTEDLDEFPRTEPTQPVGESEVHLCIFSRPPYKRFALLIGANRSPRDAAGPGVR